MFLLWILLTQFFYKIMVPSDLLRTDVCVSLFYYFKMYYIVFMTFCNIKLSYLFLSLKIII